MLIKNTDFDFAYRGFQYPLPPSWKRAIRLEDQIQWLLQALLLVNDSALNESELEEIKADLKQQLAELSDVDKERLQKAVAELNNRIDDFAKGFDIWNVTKGAFSENAESMRDLFNDLTVHSVSVDELAKMDLTVDELANSGLNVRGLAVFAGYLFGATFEPEGVFYTGTIADQKLTTKILANAVVKDGFIMAANDKE